MPGMNRTGPNGNGLMTGRGMGACGSARGACAGWGNGAGRGMRRGGQGAGGGLGLGMGRGLGMFRVGYDDAELLTAPSDDLKSALEGRVAFLRAELARTESLLGSSAANASGVHGSDNEESN